MAVSAVDYNNMQECRARYIDYYSGRNHYGTSSEDIGAIEARYYRYLAKWQAAAESNDENDYDWDGDAGYGSYVDSGKTNAKERVETRHAQRVEENDGTRASTHAIRQDFDSDNTTKGDSAIVGAVGGAAVAGSVLGVVATALSLAGIASKVGNTPITKIMLWAAASVMLAAAIAVKLTNANGAATNACQVATEELAEQQAELDATEEELVAITNEMVEKAEEAEETNEDGNDEIAEEKAKYDVLRGIFNSLQAKIDSGEGLSEDEQSLYMSLQARLGEASKRVDSTMKATSAEVKGINSELDDIKGEYEIGVEAIGEVQGFTDYVASFDEQTRINTEAMQALMYIAAAASFTTAVLLIVAPTINIFDKTIDSVFAGVAGAAGGIFLSEAIMQSNYEAIVNETVETREVTQDETANTQDFYDTEIDNGDAVQAGLQELTMIKPDDMDAPASKPSTAGSITGANGATPSATTGSNKAGGIPVNSTGGAPTTGDAGSTSAKNDTSTYTNIIDILDGKVDKAEIKSDSKGRVILAPQYARAITTTLGLDSNLEVGGSFDKVKIPQMISKLTNGVFDADTIKRVMNGEIIENSFTGRQINTLTGDEGDDVTVNNSDKYTSKLKKVIDFYEPIFTQASIKGWTRKS